MEHQGSYESGCGSSESPATNDRLSIHITNTALNFRQVSVPSRCSITRRVTIGRAQGLAPHRGASLPGVGEMQNPCPAEVPLLTRTPTLCSIRPVCNSSRTAGSCSRGGVSSPISSCYGDAAPFKGVVSSRNTERPWAKAKDKWRDHV